jgi:hypothetical protein
VTVGVSGTGGVSVEVDSQDGAQSLVTSRITDLRLGGVRRHGLRVLANAAGEVLRRRLVECARNVEAHRSGNMRGIAVASLITDCPG